MASKSCCPDGSWPALAVSTDDARAGSMLGVTETLGADLTVYTVPPPAPSTMGVVFVYDVHGFAGVRVKSVCDVSAGVSGSSVYILCILCIMCIMCILCIMCGVALAAAISKSGSSVFSASSVSSCMCRGGAVAIPSAVRLLTDRSSSFSSLTRAHAAGGRRSPPPGFWWLFWLK